jgi:hypothetical protein
MYSSRVPSDHTPRPDELCLPSGRRETFARLDARQRLRYNEIGIFKGGSAMLGELFQADLETWKQFLTDRWYVLAIALVVVLLVIKIVKTVVKWLLVAVIVIGVLLYSGYSLEDLRVDKLKELGAQIKDQAVSTLTREVIEAMAGESSEAVYTAGEDGTFTVKSNSLVITGKIGESEVSITYLGAPLGRVKLDETITTFIDQAKAAS